MREIKAVQIEQAVASLFIHANKNLPEDITCRMRQCREQEPNQTAKMVLSDLLDNCAAAKELDIPVCQDTGMAVVFAELGCQCCITGDTLENAINAGVRQAYLGGKLRLSVVNDPLERVNTNDNTPAIIHISTNSGDQLKITAAPKGFGSENMSRLQMFTPSATEEDIICFVVETVTAAASNPCPPVVVGVGIGGDFEYSAVLAKKALCRSIDQRNPNPVYQKLEQEMLRRMNQTDIGPQGFGGNTTALAVNIEQFATHIAGLPVAVNIGCYVTRHQSILL